MLLFEDGKEALFLPGSKKQFFTLKQYKEELGRDYNKITLYLCTKTDFILQEVEGCRERKVLEEASTSRKRFQSESSDDEDEEFFNENLHFCEVEDHIFI